MWCGGSIVIFSMEKPLRYFFQLPFYKHQTTALLTSFKTSLAASRIKGKPCVFKALRQWKTLENCAKDEWGQGNTGSLFVGMGYLLSASKLHTRAYSLNIQYIVCAHFRWSSAHGWCLTKSDLSVQCPCLNPNSCHVVTNVDILTYLSASSDTVNTDKLSADFERIRNRVPGCDYKQSSRDSTQVCLSGTSRRQEWVPEK